MNDPLTIADFRRIAQRRLPKFVFDYADGGAGDETTMHLNRAAFARLRFHPRQQIEPQVSATPPTSSSTTAAMGCSQRRGTATTSIRSG
jgi:isopentenyl diphosphate isomerase/L-lactate dehydrogenase-like FMN-dependent dehydrogenase